VSVIERETFESALQLGRRALGHLGWGAYRAREATLKFREHNKGSVDAVYPFYKDREQYASMAKRARDELNEMFARDLKSYEKEAEKGWD
jgi:glutathione-regulated potassium-efflux system ancillary protein KefC